MVYSRGLSRLVSLQAELWLRAHLRRGSLAYQFRRRMQNSSTVGGAQGAPQPFPPPTHARARYLLLVRHGQATFNLDGRHPGQLPGIPLTDQGRRQAHAAAVALAALPLTTVIASPLERARDTAEIIARGWALPVRLEPRLMDTDVGPWSGKKPDELRDDPAWKAFVAHPTEAPAGVESLAVVQARAISVVQEVLSTSEAGNCVVLVTHGDVVKLILAHYLGIRIDCVRYLVIGNASISALAFTGEESPEVVAINWTPAPRWLTPEPSPSALPAEGTAGGAAAEPAEPS